MWVLPCTPLVSGSQGRQNTHPACAGTVQATNTIGAALWLGAVA